VLERHVVEALFDSIISFSQGDLDPAHFEAVFFRELLGSGLTAAGSGEVFATLKKTAALGHMRRSGIRHVEINAVDDNVLWRPADPFFIGFAASSGIDAAAKVMDPADVAAAYAAAMSGGSSSSSGGNGAAQHDPQQLLDESIGFLVPAVGSYYFSFSALSAAAGKTKKLSMLSMLISSVLKCPWKYVEESIACPCHSCFHLSAVQER
jgi:hypothetical protein